MHILYVGKHDNAHSNDDEGAITKSLRELGHRVTTVQEETFRTLDHVQCDVILFNHCKRLHLLDLCKTPKVFWCFDRIYWDGTGLKTRNAVRTEWANKALQISKVGFFTDGDWVANDKTGKAVWLTQGYNQYLKPVTPSGEEKGKILFTGGGKDYGRDNFVSDMKRKYTTNFKHVPKGVYGDSLAQLVAKANIVVAPPTPVTDRYWSNRIYLTLGLGGFLLHPFTQGLTEDFTDSELRMYDGATDLHCQIKYFLHNIEDREGRRVMGQLQVQTYHTYRHRCEQLIKEVENRL